jgi:hypothetical protein
VAFVIHAGLQFVGELNAYLGPLKLTLANANIVLGSPLTIEVLSGHSSELQRDVIPQPPSAKAEVSVNGEASFSTEVLVFGEPVCWLSIQIPQLEMYLNGHASPVVTTQHCGDGFIETIKDKLKDNPIFKFFANPGLFMNQLQRGFLSLDSKLFGSDGAIRDLVIPLVDNELANLIKRAAIDKIIGPATSRTLLSELTEMINDILFNHKFTVNQTKIEELVLAGVTDVLCRILKPTVCPSVPSVASPYYDWPIVYDKELIHKPITKFSFGLGEHGVAGLYLNCTLLLLLEYHFSFIIRYSKTYGIQIVFPEEPDFVFAGTARLDFSPSVCRMEGELGFLAAELHFSDGNELQGTLRVSQSKTRWRGNVDLVAALLAKASLGITPSLAEKLVHAEDPIQALPHFGGKMSFYWHWTLTHRPTAPIIQFIDFEFCIGSLLSHLIHDITQRFEIALGPMQKVLGRNGLLLQKIEPTKYIFGRTLTVVEALQIVVQHFCRGECVFKNVLEALRTFQEYYSHIEVLETLVSVLAQDDGCGVFQMVRNFSADFSKPKVDPVWTGPIPPSDLQFKPGRLPDRDRLKTAEFYAYCTVRTQGNWGLHWLVTSRELPRMIIELISGHDVALLELTIPGLVISAGAHWGVPVWWFPYVELGVEVIATLKAELGGLMFTTAGIRQLAQTGNVGHIWNSLAIRTVRDDGSVIRQLEGSITLGGYVYIYVFIFDGSASVFLRLSAGISIADVNHIGYVTFDQFFFLLRQGLNKAFTISIRLEAGFTIRIRACALFACWTVVSIQNSFPLWGKDFDSTAGQLDLVATPQMDANLNIVKTLTSGHSPRNQSPVPRFAFLSDPQDPSVVQISFSPFAAMEPPLSRRGYKQSPIEFVGSAAGVNFDYEIYGVHQTVVIPGSNTGVNVKTSSYTEATQLVIDCTSLSMDIPVGGIQFPHGCRQLVLHLLLSDTSIIVNGLPCPLNIEAQPSTNISLGGSPSLYRERPISIYHSSVNMLMTTVAVSALEVWTTSIKGDNGSLSVTFPSGATRMSLGCDPHRNCTFIHHESDGNVQLFGGEGWDRFICSSIDKVRGMLYWKGNGGVNFGYVTLPTPPQGMRTVIAPNSIVYRGGGSNSNASFHTIALEEIQVKTVHITGYPNARTDISISTIESGGVVNLYVQGTATGEIVINATGCDATGNAYIQLSGGGIQTVVFSSSNQISYLGCTFHVYGSDDKNEVDVIVIKASAELRSLDWEFYRNGIKIVDLLNTRNSFWIIYENIERILVEFSHNVSSRVTVYDGTFNTEMLLMFSANSSASNEVTICRTTSTILINGSFTVYVGPTKHRCNFLPNFSKSLFDSLPVSVLPSDNPLNYLGGQLIVINAKASSRPIRLQSGRNGSQYFTMNSFELNPLDEHFTVPPLISLPTPWMCQLCAENGLNTCSRAHLVYKGNFQLSLVTGSGADYFEGSGVTIPVNVQLGDGNDIVRWKSTSQPANFDLGLGLDEFVCRVPLGPTVVWNGEDHDPDLTQVYQGGSRPNWRPPIIAPVGPAANDKITLNQYYPPEDIVEILVDA